MLRRVEVENFYSFKTRETLDLTVTGKAPNVPHRLIEVPSTTERLPAVVAIFGANASGKTSLLRAVSFVPYFVQGLATWEAGKAGPFLSHHDTEWLRKPTRLYVEFYSDLIERAGICLYAYELVMQAVDTGGANDVVVREAFSYAPKGRMRRLFERNGSDFQVSDDFEIKRDDPRLGFVGPTASTFAVLAKFNHTISIEFLKRAEKVQSNVALTKFAAEEEHAAKYYKDNPAVLAGLKHAIGMMDLGIEDVVLEDVDDKPRARFKHKGQAGKLNFYFESKGTQNFFCIFPYLFYALNRGGLAVLDELDSDIHPLLLPEIIRWFHDPEVNRRRAQLIMTCHNATLLEHLIKEEVFFTEKTADGHTRVYGLQDIEGVRRDTNLYSKYLGGAFGAVPVVG